MIDMAKAAAEAARKKREEAGLTQEQMAIGMGVTQRYVSMLERCEVGFDPVIIMRYSKAIDKFAKKPPMNNKKIGLKMSARRKKCGVRQEEMAEKIGVSRSFLSQLERGESRWKQAYIDKYESALTEFMVEVLNGRRDSVIRKRRG